MLPNEPYAHFQSMYPLLVQQFVDDYALMEGVAVDIGTGPGSLGLELAKITRMHLTFVDLSREALNTANRTFTALALDNEADFVQTDVHALPFRDGYADFVMSRGSIWFWETPHKGLEEIYRILKPGGVAVVGGGLGRYTPPSMRERLQRTIKRRLAAAGETRPDEDEFRAMVEKARLPTYTILSDGPGVGGRWVEIRKQMEEQTV